MKLKKAFSFILIVSIAMGLCSCGNVDNAEKFSDTYWDSFDTMISITAYCKNEKEFEDIDDTAHELFFYYHKLFDIYNNYEGLNNAKTINDNAGIAPVMVDQPLIDLIEYAKDLYKETNGQVNIAFGAVLKQWHEAREAVNNGQDAVLPSLEDLKAAAEHCSPEDIIIDENNSTVFLKDPQMSLDLGAVAKGYATELVMDALAEDGCTGIIVSAGGNTKAIGTKPQNTPWTVAIQNPDKDAVNYAQVISIADVSVVTSGTYERYFDLDGKRYHHIINKDTLMPENNFLSVTIVTEDSGYADALSTAVFNMSLDEGLGFINSIDNTEAMWILNDNSQVFSDNFEALIPKK